MAGREGAIVLCLLFSWASQKAGGAEGSRTPDLLIANEALYQLSYGPRKARNKAIAPAAVKRPLRARKLCPRAEAR
jgi:hypothetical protein